MVALVLALMACNTDEVEGVPPAPTDLEPVDLLTRASLDLRGVRPTVAEIERVEADPAAVDVLLDEYLADERFEARVRDLFAEVYLTRTEGYGVNLSAFDLDGYTDAQVLASIGDEPLRLLGYVAANDLPITELVTADYTVANEVLDAMWPIDYPDGETGWRKVHWTDGRPAAGVLASNGLWWRYSSTDSNANRKRANTVSRILLCHDYLTRPIDFDRNVNLLDTEAISDALRTNPSCTNCHVSLDPMASYFFGFWAYNDDSGLEVASYHPERENRWEDFNGTPPGFYGEPGSSLTDLGRQIAADNRFPECMVEHTYELLLRRDVELADWSELTAHREALLDGDLALRPLFKSVMSSPRYRAGTDEGLIGAVPLKMATPNLLASQIEDLTGFRWVDGDGWDLMQSETTGYLSLAGGADGYYVTQTAKTPNTTLLLTQERLAEAASSYVVTHDLANPADARLFAEIAFTETPETDRDAMARQLQLLHLRLFGDRVASDGPEVQANLELWSDLYAVDQSVPGAWEGVLSALLRDPDLLFY